MDKILFSAVMFMGFLALLSASFFGSSYTLVSSGSQPLGTGGENITIVSSGGSGAFSAFPVCEFTGDWLGDVLATAGCMASGLGWLFGLLAFNSDIPYISVIFWGVGAVILYRIIRILKPTGGS